MALSTYVWVTKLISTTTIVPATATSAATSVTSVETRALKDETQLGIRDMVSNRYAMTREALVDNKAFAAATLLAKMNVYRGVPAVAEVKDADGNVTTAAQEAIAPVGENIEYRVVLERNPAAEPHLILNAIEMKEWAEAFLATQEKILATTPTLRRPRTEDTGTTSTKTSSKDEC